MGTDRHLIRIGLRSFLMCCLALMALTHVGAASAAAQTDAQVQAALKELKASGETFLKLIEPLTQEQWDFRPQGVRRSIGNEAEHVALSENDLQRVVQQALDAKVDPVKAKQLAGKEKEVKEQMLNPERTAEFYKVPGRLNSKAEVQEFFQRAHRNAIQMLESSEDLSTHIHEHPNEKYGELTGMQWFYYITYHKLRHCNQIKAIMARPGFPTGQSSADD